MIIHSLYIIFFLVLCLDESGGEISWSTLAKSEIFNALPLPWRYKTMKHNEQVTVVATRKFTTSAHNPAHLELKRYYEKQILAQETSSVGSEPLFFEFSSIFHD